MPALRRSAWLARCTGRGFAVVTILSCGSPFDSTGVVVSADQTEVCVTRSGDLDEPRQCFDPGDAGNGQQFEVGDCVDLRFSGEGGRVLETRPATCAEEWAGGEAPGTDDEPDGVPPAGVGWVQLGDSRIEIEVVACESGGAPLAPHLYDDAALTLALTARADEGPDGGPFGFEFHRSSGPGESVGDQVFLWEGAREDPIVAWQAQGEEGESPARGLRVSDGLLAGIDRGVVSGSTPVYLLDGLSYTDEQLEFGFMATCPDADSLASTTTTAPADPPTSDEPGSTSTTAP